MKNHNYAQGGAYFVTACTQNRVCLFGEVVGGRMERNEAGLMIEGGWREIPTHYHGVEIDVFVVMPNHIHGIVILNGPSADLGQSIGPTRERSIGPTQGRSIGPTQGSAPTLSLSEVVKRFKTLTTRRYIQGVAASGWPRFDRHVWQDDYYDHVVRDEIDLQRVREYIENNPIAWMSDPDNPSASP